MSKETEMTGCGITIINRQSTVLELFLNFVQTHETTVVSPKFTINGVITFEFKVERRDTDRFSLFVRFKKKRVNDKLDYGIKYTHWTEREMKFNNPDIWHFVCSNGSCTGTGTISVEVNLETLSSPCASLYEDTELTDFKLLGDDGYVLLHKAIAAAYSPFFKNMFLGQWKETTEGVIEVSGISKATLEHFKEYMYLGTFPDTCLTQLLLLAKFYMMEDLESRCLFKLRSQVTKDNVFDLLEFAVTNKQTRLLYEILDVAQQGDLKVDELEEFQKYL
ncbi:unnamed protein product [Arctia plantaginis]|uniref:BTB domain-containing protein n=1 Tax=Arctia plantaginis TaxID=874455 RepID=A0A8S1BFG7_ARCPL|nr:unnamed protein product [Arctia plantaginis]